MIARQILAILNGYTKDVYDKINESLKPKIGTPKVKPTPPETKILKEGERPKVNPEYLKTGSKKWWKLW